jgi:hypothetical protein
MVSPQGLTPTQWTYNSLAVLKLTGTGSSYTHTLRLTETLTSGESASVEFQVGGPRARQQRERAVVYGLRL